MHETSPLLDNRTKAPVSAQLPAKEQRPLFKRSHLIGFIIVNITLLCLVYSIVKYQDLNNADMLGAAWSSKAAPLSITDPATLGIQPAYRPGDSQPGPAFRTLINRGIPLPTNSWYENLLIGPDNTVPESNVFQVPYILDTSGSIVGVRTHPSHVQASSKIVMMTYELANGVSLGAVEDFNPQHSIHSQGLPAISKLAIELQWHLKTPPNVASNATSVSRIRAPLVRGAPYTSMIYEHATPRIYVARSLSAPIVVDNDPTQSTLVCGDGKTGKYSAHPVLVRRELKIQFDTSDMSWLVFVSEPMEFVCSQYDAARDVVDMDLPPGVLPPSGMHSFFDLRAVRKVQRGMVRVAMANNCTTGQNPQYCGPEHKAHNQSQYEHLLRTHAQAYPTAAADVEFTFPVQSAEEEELRLIFNFKPAMMSDLAKGGGAGGNIGDISTTSTEARQLPTVELLMFALPHHQERMRTIIGSSNMVQNAGCMPTIHGTACPAIGGSWSLVEHLHRTSFYAFTNPQQEMLGDIHEAALKDLTWRLPDNYMRGAGDTYFSGKLLAKLARILLIADEVGLSQTQLFHGALQHLKEGVQVWLNGSAESPFIYDRAWGGMVTCGCNYHWDEETRIGSCWNRYPDCPALTDPGQNFGAGFYNDHHYHYGYHIYAAAVASKFDNNWARTFHQQVLLLIRDIANPSDEDPFFPTWRHKDWYLGFSWASGIVMHLNKPFPNGRNQESVSEAIAAYEAVAMYGDVMQGVFFGSAEEEDRVLYDSALRTRDMGRLLMATEIRAAKTYWHVQSPDTPGVDRIYPSVYESKVVGMMWSMLAQQQTWFGNEPWKSYGIQLLPITPAAGLRDNPNWVSEMLPIYTESCMNDTTCPEQGWSVVIYTCMATIGQWREAWKLTKQLDADVFEAAGGNGHSMTNTLWYIATRSDPADYVN